MADGNYAMAMKKRSVGVTAYLATVHGYPNNLSVCQEVTGQKRVRTSTQNHPGNSVVSGQEKLRASIAAKATPGGVNERPQLEA